jgi:hypothetical protein
MTADHSDLMRDYFVITKRYGRSRKLSTWEIQRRSKPLGVKFCGDSYSSEQAAKLAGEKALRQFLGDLRQDKE